MLMTHDDYLSCRESIFNVLASMGNLSSSNRNWLVEVHYNYKTREADLVFSLEMPEWNRNTTLSASSYIIYVSGERKLYGIKEQGIIYYNFIEKIIDERNNLIIIAEPDSQEIKEFGELAE